MFLPGLLLELTKTEETLKGLKSLMFPDSKVTGDEDVSTYLDSHIKACQDARNTIMCLGNLVKCSYCDCKETCLFKERRQVKEAREANEGEFDGNWYHPH